VEKPSGGGRRNPERGRENAGVGKEKKRSPENGGPTVKWLSRWPVGVAKVRP